MGVGKSTAGKKLAKNLGWDFVDTDKIFEETYKLSIAAFFNKYGEKLFRSIEYEILKSTFVLSNTVVSTGGGMPCFFNAMQAINNNGISVYLQMSENAIVSRLINSKQKRPLVISKSKAQLAEFVKNKLSEREQIYLQAQIEIPALSINIQSLAAQIIYISSNNS